MALDVFHHEMCLWLIAPVKFDGIEWVSGAPRCSKPSNRLYWRHHHHTYLRFELFFVFPRVFLSYPCCSTTIAQSARYFALPQ